MPYALILSNVLGVQIAIMCWYKVSVSPKIDVELIHGIILQLVVLVFLIVIVKITFISLEQEHVQDATIHV